ncbi:MAG TPA: hypothetical protein VME44_01110 [Streptosporangiaceae bacterium]|nr:hypothetical protein [Streptosporangiaceae bacterium]
MNTRNAGEIDFTFAVLYVAEAAGRTQARAEMISILDQLIEGLTA